MVHLARLLFLSVSLVTIVFGNLLKRTVTQIEGDIANISSLVNILCDDINGFPASGLAGALSIHQAVGNLVTAFNTATSDIEATGSISEADAQRILATLAPILSLLEDCTGQMTTKRPNFMALPIGGLQALILQDLKNLKTAIDALLLALGAIIPPDLVAQVGATQTDIDSVFAAAITAFS
ncbi:hydrophobic surface binding protein [Mycena leptocephala]|nr:hydrophobic surface binding protein [Mycena leptocephala]